MRIKWESVRSGIWTACGLGLLLIVSGTVAADTLGDRLRPLIEAHEGQVGLAVKHLKTGESFAHQADVPMPTASLIKFPIMVEAYRQSEQGKLDLQKSVTLRKEDKVPGSGILTTHFSPGMTMPVVDAIQLMMAYSDNTATNLVLDQIGLPATNATMEELGFPITKIHAKVFRGDTSIHPDRSKQFGLGSTTAGEMVQLLAMLDAGKVGSPESTQAMRKHLAACEDKRLSKTLPAQIKAIQKTGSVTAVRTVAGILELPSGPVAVCVLTNENKDRRWTPDNAGEVFSAKVGRAVFDHFEPNWGLAGAQTGDKLLRLGAQGVRVEKLQAALNKSGKLERDLQVDGEFGAQTQAGVRQWQKSTARSESGEIDLAAWEALGLPAGEYNPIP
jgi:beta-lactamase class A